MVFSRGRYVGFSLISITEGSITELEGGVDSSIRKIEVGVPQGSCLGPLLLLIYIIDLPKAVNSSTVPMYADDTSLCLKSKDISELNRAMNRDLEDLDSWLKGNKLSLNVVITQSMLVATKPRHQALDNAAENLKFEIHGSELQVVTKTRYLGIQVDNSLDWKEHIKVISSKISRAIGFLKYAKNILPIYFCKKKLYTSIVEPHFRYCCSVWGCCGATTINQLQQLQNRSARILLESSYNTPSRPLIKSLAWKTIRELVDEEPKLIVYKSINGLAPQYLRNLFNRNSFDNAYSLRNTTTDLKIPKKMSNNGQKSFSYRGAKLWNSLPAEAKRSPSVCAFKSSIY